MNGPAVAAVSWAFALLAVVAGWRVFRTPSMVRASYALLASFVAVAALLVLLTAEYLGVALVFMMALEMTVMALFMVAFMMNPAGLNPMRMVHQQRAAIALGALGGAALAAVALAPGVPARPPAPVPGTIQRLGHEMLGPSMLVFESAGIALLVTMVAVIVLSTRSSRYGTPSDEGSGPPALEPEREPAPSDPAPSSERARGHG